LEDLISKWDPSKDPNIKSDPNNTLFIGNLDTKISEEELKRKFEDYGNVLSIKIIKNEKKKKDFTYAFVEFEKHKDFKFAYQNANGRRIGKSNVIVDYERGRTVSHWKPKRLGGGLGVFKTLANKNSYEDKNRNRNRDDKYDSYSGKRREEKSSSVRSERNGGERRKYDEYSRKDERSYSKHYEERDRKYRDRSPSSRDKKEKKYKDSPISSEIKQKKSYKTLIKN